MDTYSQAAWERLGAALKERRVALGYAYRRRQEFARDTGMGAKTLQRIENGERSAYPTETIAQAEAAYQLEPGSITDHLRGGHLRPLADREPLTARDAYEAAVLASSLPAAEKDAAIRGHRERMARELAELGIAGPPPFLTQGVMPASDGGDERGQRGGRPA